MINTQNIFAITEVIVQISNQVQPNKYNAPVLVKGLNIVLDDQGKVIYEAAAMDRPMASLDFTPEILQALNLQFNKLGLEIKPLSENNKEG